LQRLSDSQREYLREATTRYWNAIPGSPAEEYLESRGLYTEEVTNRFLLGYVADPLPGHEHHRGSLAIPYLRKSPDNELTVVSVRFRCIQDHDHVNHGKYMTQAGDRPRMYNTEALLKPGPSVAITEGELDAIAAFTAGVEAVGVPGAESWAAHFPMPFKGYKEVFILADGDDAGMRFANTVAKTLPNAKIIQCPPGSDVNDLTLNYGPDKLRERLK
jgi:hypothetical protein